MRGLPSGSPLDEALLARRASLPSRLAPVELEGRRVRLVPLELGRHLAPLYARTNGQPAHLADRHVEAYDPDTLIWRYMSGGPFTSPEELAGWLRPQIASLNGLCLCVLDAPTGEPVGTVSFLANAPEHLKVELGSIWYSPLVQRSGANTESTYLMLRHAFELGYRRVEWKCDVLNERSRAAALKMGFTFEGIQEYHYIVKGRSRDTAWFRVLDHEWPAVKDHLERLLDRM